MLKRLGFIGAGKQAQAHAKAAVQCGATIIGLYLPKPTKSQNIQGFSEAAGIKPGGMMPVGDNLNKFLTTKDFDAIIVAAPWNVIPEMMPELVVCPLPMLIEKPILLGGGPHYPAPPVVGQKFVGMNRRFYDVVDHMKTAIKDLEIISVEAHWSDDTKAEVERHDESILPYLMEMKSIHLIDLLYYLFGGMAPDAHRWSKPGVVDAMLWAGVEPVHFPIHLSITRDNPCQSGIIVRTTTGTHTLSPLEKYASPTLRVVEAYGAIKAGVYNQMYEFLHEKTGTLSTIADAIYIHNLINELRG